MEIFYRLLFGHLLADFTFQTNHLADWKRHSMMGLFVHVAIHPLCYLALTWPFLGQTWQSYGGVALSGWMCVTLATVIHFLEDWFRVTRIEKGWRDNTAFYVWDQAVHLVALWFLAPHGPSNAPVTWPVIGCLFVVVTHFATVTIWFIEKDINGRDYPETEEKYLAILQRLVVWLAFFLPQPWWLLVLAFVLFTFGRHVWHRRVDFSRTSVVLGNAIAILCGALVRWPLNLHL